MGRNTWQNLIYDDPRGLSADGLTLASFTTSAPIFPTFILPKNFMKTGRVINIKARHPDVHDPASEHCRHDRHARDLGRDHRERDHQPGVGTRHRRAVPH
jgi:hypothetical protein